MAEELTSSTLGSLDSTPLGTMTGALQGGLNSLLSSGTNILDRFFPPERRNELKAKIMKFATEKPMLASFLLSQIAVSGLPLAIFITFTFAVVIFALLAALIIAVLGSVLFAVFCVGVSLIIVLPILFVTTFSATFIWLWGVGAYQLIKWFNKKPVPGVHTTMKDGLIESTGLGSIQSGLSDALNGKLPPSYEQDPSSRPGQATENGANGQSEKPASTQPKPNQPSEKKTSPQSPAKSRGESPASTKSPARSTPVKSTGSDMTNAGGELRKKTTGSVSSLSNATGITA